MQIGVIANQLTEVLANTILPHSSHTGRTGLLKTHLTLLMREAFESGVFYGFC